VKWRSILPQDAGGIRDHRTSVFFCSAADKIIDLVLALRELSGACEAHCLAVTVYVMVAGYAENLILRYSGCGTNGVKQLCYQFVFLGIPLKCQIASRQNEIRRRTFVRLFGNVIAHRLQHDIL
jgi:hypothetical protein